MMEKEANLKSGRESKGGGEGAGLRDKIGAMRQGRMVRAGTAPNASNFLSQGHMGAIPTPPQERPDTVAASAGLVDQDLLIDDSSDEEDEGVGWADEKAFTPVSSKNKRAGEGWAEEEENDLMLTSYNGEDFDDLETNLGDDFLNLFAPSPPPVGRMK